MPSFEPLKTELVDLYKKLEVKRVVYFHCDHWEPWQPVKPGGPPRHSVFCPENLESIARFTDQIAQIDFARRLTLFYKPNVNSLVAEEASPGDTRLFWAATIEDRVRFIDRIPEEKKIAFDALAYLQSNTSCELQLHLHHENYTYNTDQSSEIRRNYLSSDTGRAYEEQRLNVAIRATLEHIAEDSGKPLERWFFVHGHWGLNASDPSVCHLTREIEILHANGCRGDFTVPSGRPVVNPRLEVPYFITPHDAPKGYDRQEAEPEFAYGNKTAPDRGKFLIWSSVIKHKGSSLDYSTPWMRQRLENVAVPARDLITQSFRAGGTVYMKTHAHSLHPDYSDTTRLPICPHALPGIQTLFCLLFDAAAAAGCQVDFLTVSEVYDEFVSAEYQPADGFGLTIPGHPPAAADILPAPRNWRPDMLGVRVEGMAAETPATMPA
jgi:hypothetical protein